MLHYNEHFTFTMTSLSTQNFYANHGFGISSNRHKLLKPNNNFIIQTTTNSALKHFDLFHKFVHPKIALFHETYASTSDTLCLQYNSRFRRALKFQQLACAFFLLMLLC